MTKNELINILENEKKLKENKKDQEYDSKEYIENIDKFIEFLKEKKDYTDYNESIREFKKIEQKQDNINVNELYAKVKYSKQNEKNKERLKAHIVEKREYYCKIILKVLEENEKYTLEFIRENRIKTELTEENQKLANIILDYIDCTRKEIIKELRKD